MCEDRGSDRRLVVLPALVEAACQSQDPFEKRDRSFHPGSERLGMVEVVISKAHMRKAVTSVFLVNITISIALALALLMVLRYFTRRVTHPLYNLSEIMGMAKQGQTNVRALHDGPTEISTMAHAFNNMMAALEEALIGGQRTERCTGRAQLFISRSCVL